jgi:hypothetical protein
MARFVAEGYLRFDALVPDDINRRVIAELQGVEVEKLKQAVGKETLAADSMVPRTLTPLSQCYPEPSVLGEMLRLPEVAGILTSLVGADPLYDHDFVHHLPPGSTWRQHLHVDAIVDSSAPSFDVQLFYFPEEVAEGGGGTRFVPGSHLRRARAEGVSRYQHIVGERHFAGPAGTILIFHQGLWHAGVPNPGDRHRWMYKIRLNPRQPQVRLWNTEDLEAVHNAPDDHTFAHMRTDSVGHVLRAMQPWQQGHEARYELLQRARLWRYLTDDPAYDVDYYLTRIESRAGLGGHEAPA